MISVGVRNCTPKGAEAIYAEAIYGVFGLFSPGAQVIGIQGNAKQIRWNKAKLSRAKPYEAEDRAVCAGDQPSLP